MTNSPRDLIAPAAVALELIWSKQTPRITTAELEHSLGEALSGDEAATSEFVSWLTRVAESHGLRLLEVLAEAPRISDLTQAEGPSLVVIPAKDGTPCRIVVLQRSRRGRVLMTFADPGGETSQRAVRPAELEEALGVDPQTKLSWLFPQSISPSHGAESPEGRGEPLRPWERLVRLCRPDRADLLAVLFFGVAIGILMLATPIAVQALVNFVALGGAIQPLIVVAILLFVGLGFAGVLRAFQTWTVEVLQRRFFVRMVADLSARLPRVSAEVGDRSYGPELVNRFFDVVTIQKVGSFLLLDGLSIVLGVLVGLVVLAFYHPLLLAFDIVLLAVIAVIVFGPLARGVKTAILESKAKYAVEAKLEELARNPRIFKMSGTEPWVFDRCDRLARNYVNYRKSHFRILFMQIIAASVLQVVASTALLGIGGWLVMKGSLTLGQLVAAELIVTLVVSSVAKMGKHIEGYYDLMAATDKVGQLLDLPTEKHAGEHPVHPLDVPPASLEFADVSWSLPGAEPPASPISFSLAPGERAAISGPSGSGKGTLLEFAWRLREPDAGVVTLDNRDVRELSLDSLRRDVSIVASGEVVEASLRENVRLGRPFVSDDAVREALERVALADEIARLPEGLDTPLSALGLPLSSGQFGRLQIARAIVGRPRLLLVPELPGHLSDSERARVLDLLAGDDAPWSLLIASNDRDVLARCDRILDLPSGRVVNRGSEAQGLPQ